MDARAGIKSPDTTAIGVAGLDVRAAQDRDFAAQQAALGKFQGQPARLLVVVDFPGDVLDFAVRGIHRQRQADLHPRQRPFVFSGGGDLSRHGLRQGQGPQSVRHRGRLSRRLSDGPDHQGRRHRGLAAGALLLQHASEQAAVAVPVQADLAAERRRIANSPPRTISPNAASSNPTGSAPTTAAAMWWRG